MEETIIITHSGKFHADDVFAVAVLSLVLEKEGKKMRVIRTRDPEIIKTGDYVVDVGHEYDPSRNRFDHHQIEGAGKRDNGIPYASFGLVWKKYGEHLAGSPEAADMIDKKLIQPIDMIDNGENSCVPKIAGVYPHTISDIVMDLNPKKHDTYTHDEGFAQAVQLALKLLERTIELVRYWFVDEKEAQKIYTAAADKRLLVFDSHVSDRHFVQFPEPLFLVYQGPETSDWLVEAVLVDPDRFERRKWLPQSWAGKEHAALAKITGVSDSVFCHRHRFLAAARSKEGALKLAQLALENKE